MKKILTTLLAFSFTFTLFSQEPPITTEILFGNERVDFSLSLNKPISGKFRFNNITTASAYYNYVFPTDISTFSRNEIVVVNSFIYQFHPNIGLSGGVQYHFLKGLVPIAAMHFSYADPTWLFVLTPYLDFMPYMAAELVGIIEYKPLITNNLRLYTRAQGLYAYDMVKNEIERGMAYFRLGLSKKKYTIGLGLNLDYYSPDLPRKENYGGFFMIEI